MTTFFSAPTSPIFEIISFFLIFYLYQLQYTEVTKTKKTLFLRCFLEVRRNILQIWFINWQPYDALSCAPILLKLLLITSSTRLDFLFPIWQNVHFFFRFFIILCSLDKEGNFWIRYTSGNVWTLIYPQRHKIEHSSLPWIFKTVRAKKNCGFKNIRICIDKALVILPFENELNFYRKNCKCSKCYTFVSYSWSTRN